MEARRLMIALVATLTLALTPAFASGASARSQNFIVSADTPALAQKICRAAEDFRRDLATEWLGAELPPWQQPCPIRCQVHPQLGAGGATQFSFSRQGTPFGWSMSVQGSEERVLDSVLPHEITHTIFATHFGRPLPRWADEGACTVVEHTSEKHKQDRFLIEFLMTERGIPFNKMFAMKEYPSDMLPLYAQGYSLARYLIMQGGKRKYVQYIGEGMQTENWPVATRKYYGHKDLSDLQVTWLEWVRMGSPRLQPVEGVEGRGNTMIAANTAAIPAAANNQVAAVAPQQTSNETVTNAMPNVVAAQRSPIEAVPTQPNVPAHALIAKNAHTPTMRPADFTKNLETVNPPRPGFETASAAEARPANNVARPYSEGWYSKRRDEAQQGGSTQSLAAPAQAPLRPQPPTELAPVRSAQESATVPATAPPANRRVMMEWSRPTGQPWAPDASPAATASLARANKPVTHREAAADSSSTVWR